MKSLKVRRVEVDKALEETQAARDAAIVTARKTNHAANQAEGQNLPDAAQLRVEANSAAYLKTQAIKAYKDAKQNRHEVWEEEVEREERLRQVQNDANTHYGYMALIGDPDELLGICYDYDRDIVSFNFGHESEVSNKPFVSATNTVQTENVGQLKNLLEALTTMAELMKESGNVSS